MVLTVLTALAEPTRLAAMRILSDGQEHCVCELMARLDVTQSRMSRHMKVLAQAGLIRGRRDAQWVRYQLDPQLTPAISAVLEAVMTADTETEKRVA
ncbi:ArsR/SmtB family transcription factor [Aliiroseovarius sp. PTFE2010]|uniref:ArsR/SmtB family transcription factor n=1 Tax=Aliiroseovarius sp. PTFE2010 TaxID=3417190 RepID=UPI003CE76E32